MTLQAVTGKSVIVSGVRLHVTLSGLETERPVMILHGFTGNVESMAGVIAELEGTQRAIGVDLVGHGRSEAPDDVAHYRMDRCVEQVLELAARLCDRPPHLLGYSMGGRVALSAASQKPDAFASLLLVGASAGLADDQARIERVRADEALADRIEQGGVEAFVDAWMKLPLFASQSRLGAEALDLARKQRLENSPRALAQSLRGMGTGAQTPVHERLHEVDTPVCLVAGVEDEKFKAIALDLESLLPRAETHWIPGAGHAAHLENPAEFGRVARTFFSQVDQVTSTETRREA